MFNIYLLNHFTVHLKLAQLVNQLYSNKKKLKINK